MIYIPVQVKCQRCKKHFKPIDMRGMICVACEKDVKGRNYYLKAYKKKKYA